MNSQWVCMLSMPAVPSKIYMMKTELTTEARPRGVTRSKLGSAESNLRLDRNAIRNARVTRETKLIIINSAYLNDSSLSGDFEHLTFPGLSVSELDVHNLSESAARRTKLASAMRVTGPPKDGAACIIIKSVTYLGNLTLSRITRGPSTSRTVL